MLKPMSDEEISAIPVSERTKCLLDTLASLGAGLSDSETLQLLLEVQAAVGPMALAVWIKTQ
jgi:hypothetical protein